MSVWDVKYVLLDTNYEYYSKKIHRTFYIFAFDHALLLLSNRNYHSNHGEEKSKKFNFVPTY